MFFSQRTRAELDETSSGHLQWPGAVPHNFWQCNSKDINLIECRLIKSYYYWAIVGGNFINYILLDWPLWAEDSKRSASVVFLIKIGCSRLYTGYIYICLSSTWWIIYKGPLHRRSRDLGLCHITTRECYCFSIVSKAIKHLFLV